MTRHANYRQNPTYKHNHVNTDSMIFKIENSALPWHLVSGSCEVRSIKLLSNGLSFHEFRPRVALFPIVRTERLDVARGIAEWPGGKLAASGPSGFKPEPDSTEVPPYMRLAVQLSHTQSKRPPAGVVRKFGEGMPGTVSSSTSDLTPP
ncbi:hypothetical protein AVEN_172014-1 [Araneus ventricosus]|uniref:Uncharacterized protein n=1 Tax=Araneus ventricosus TaxID=182803 RepID=A0A4Y2LFH8_ARAVE|nr:hypothetical protein AVEN_172014-1 [Araneus ventricosus]